MFLAYLVAGVINCLFIITIPFGVQAFKLAGFALWPFGRVVVDRPGANSVASGCGNIIWILTGGIWLALGHALTGILLCVTIIGIPFGIQSFKLMGLALTPFGKMVVRADDPRWPRAGRLDSPVSLSRTRRPPTLASLFGRGGPASSSLEPTGRRKE
jgi:uncharacterized membrane protein YccF (DUF307 family)